jgi:hypothetical protein
MERGEGPKMPTDLCVGDRDVRFHGSVGSRWSKQEGTELDMVMVDGTISTLSDQPGQTRHGSFFL